jgi:hypothetical protein
MKVDYKYNNDRRDREGDLAREGLVYHFFAASKNWTNLVEIDEWMTENIKKKHKATVGSQSGKNRVYFRTVVLSDFEEAVLFRLRWC